MNEIEMAEWPRDYREWQGGIDELVDTAERALAAQGHSGSGGDGPLNVRLVRSYQDRNIVGRGVRQGKAATYGFRELAELVATRRLLSDGWPLAKIAQILPTMSDEALAAPLADPGETLKEVIAEFRAERPEAALSPPYRHMASSAGLVADAAPIRSLARDRPDPSQGSPPLEPKQRLELELEPWLRLSVDEATMAAVDPHEVARAADRARRELINLRRNGRRFL